MRVRISSVDKEVCAWISILLHLLGGSLDRFLFLFFIISIRFLLSKTERRGVCTPREVYLHVKLPCLSDAASLERLYVSMRKLARC